MRMEIKNARAREQEGGKGRKRESKREAEEGAEEKGERGRKRRYIELYTVCRRPALEYTQLRRGSGASKCGVQYSRLCASIHPLADQSKATHPRQTGQLADKYIALTSLTRANRRISM